MCELLVQHPHFNYTSNIITVLVPLLRRSPALADPVLQAIRSVFRDDKSGQVTLEVRTSSNTLVQCFVTYATGPWEIRVIYVWVYSY